MHRVPDPLLVHAAGNEEPHRRGLPSREGVLQAFEGPGREGGGHPLGQAEQPGGDGGQLVAERLVDLLGRGQAQAVGGDDQGVASPGGAADEVDQQPVELPPEGFQVGRAIDGNLRAEPSLPDTLDGLFELRIRFRNEHGGAHYQ